jgi:hypothetical protein
VSTSIEKTISVDVLPSLSLVTNGERCTN